jgi:beta-N-acetylhexosaminidase
MSLRSLAARTIIAGIPGPTLDDDARRIVGEWKTGGVILFRRNIVSPEQTHALIQELRALRSEPLLVSVDQEGGRVQRVRAPLTVFPPMRVLGDTKDTELALALGGQLGRELKAIGFDMDFAPVVDVDTNAENPVIGDRAFSRVPEDVSKMGCAVSTGLQSAGVYACAKHFPGHGDTREDSHKELPALPHSLERLRSVEWPPFAAAAQAKVASIMTAHVMFPALDITHPATLSEKCLSVLRQELGFEGAIISDDLEMKAIADRYDVPAAATQAIRAGCDGLLICHTPARIHGAIDAIAAEADRDGAFRARLEYAVQRMDRLLGGLSPVAGPYVPAAPPSGMLKAWLMRLSQTTAASDPTEVSLRAV